MKNPMIELLQMVLKAIIVVVFCSMLIWSLLGCKTTKTATRTVTDTVRVVRIDSVAVSKDTETANQQDEYTRITERYLPIPIGIPDTTFVSFPLPNFGSEWKYYDLHRDTITLTEYIRTPPRLIERIIEKGSSQMQWQKINYDSIARAVADSLAATKTEAVKVVEKTRFPFWIVFALLGGLGIYLFAAYRKTK
jgi:microsomal dipeptidase-like Zn-dependent dipeptidase